MAIINTKTILGERYHKADDVVKYLMEESLEWNRQAKSKPMTKELKMKLELLSSYAETLAQLMDKVGRKL